MIQGDVALQSRAINHCSVSKIATHLRLVQLVAKLRRARARFSFFLLIRLFDRTGLLQVFRTILPGQVVSQEARSGDGSVLPSGQRCRAVQVLR
jgi:hypothetical protein